MATSNQNLVDSLNNITIQFSRYSSILIFLFGTIGNIFNILILSKRIFRSNSCAFCFLGSSIASLVAIFFGLLGKILNNWTVDLSSTIDWICQLRAFIVFTSRTIAFWLIVLATLDRWFLSSIDIHRRQSCTLKKAQRGTIIILIFSVLLNSPILYCLRANVINAPLKCYSVTATCRLCTDLIYGCGTILFPSVLMTYFSIMIVSNVRQTRRRIEIFDLSTNNIVRPRRIRKKERQLMIMLLVQVLVFVLLLFPQAIEKLYITITLNLDSTSQAPMTLAISNFIFNFVVLLTYLASSLPFYIYTLCGGSIFRNECWRFFEPFVRKMRIC